MNLVFNRKFWRNNVYLSKNDRQGNIQSDHSLGEFILLPFCLKKKKRSDFVVEFEQLFLYFHLLSQ